MKSKPINYVRTVILAVCSFSVVQNAFADDDASSKKTVVFLTADDLRHSTGTHEFYAGAMLLKNSLAESELTKNVECKVINNWAGDASQLTGADLVVHYYGGNKFHLLNKNHQVVRSLADKGVSQMFMHYACDPGSAESDKAVKDWTGGVYKDKFSSNPVWTIDAQLTAHPINNGVDQYQLKDEWYMNIDFESDLKFTKTAPKAGETHCVMHGTHEAVKGIGKIKRVVGDKPTNSQLTVFWAKENQNGGRGMAVTGGHFHANWGNEQFRKQVLNAIVWGLKLDVPAQGIVSPRVTPAMLRANMDERKKGFKKVGQSAQSTKMTADAAEKKNPPKRNARKPKKRAPKKKIPKVDVGVHPLFTLQNLDFLGDDTLKISGMCFHGNSLFVTTMSPDRTNKKPDHNGKVLRIDHIKEAGLNGKKISVTELCGGLYEPAAIAVVGDSIYVGEKHRIIRFDGGVKKDQLDAGNATVMIDGTSTKNFHTYTVGFEKFERDGKTFLCGNFTTAIVLGGKRDKMIPPNKDVHRGSNFILGPVTGNESASDIKLEYFAGGFRTPNGVEVGPDNVVYVADNQGIFNPSNELHRIEPGSFYGHYLYTENGRAAAFQPKGVEPEEGSPSGQQRTTVNLPQGTVANSPAQPHVIHDRKGVLARYNGQILLCEFTKGEILRVAMEEVDGVWQGVVFRHSSGVADKNGNNGFTGGPNRLELGPDGNYYIGQIGAGRLWEYNGRQHGLQRFAVKQKAPSDFNEIVNVNVVDGGFKLEFYRPVPEGSISAEDLAISQWTYQPTQNYGGPPKGTFKLKAASLEFNSDRTSAILKINGLKDGSAKYVLKQGNSSSENSGWVTHVKFDPKVNGKSVFHTKEFWYTLHRKIGGKEAAANEIAELSDDEQIELKFQSLCMACHRETDAGWAAPNLAGILGRKQTVIRDGKEVNVTVDRDYIINAILNPAAEKPKAFKDAIMAPLGLEKKEAGALADYIIGLKK
ncbi:hypothetical protein NT6N_09430 [Oceaniferula spumae]|uniref:Cytochrome c domain-containing protein n=1 Tax=Oceaniferula spumae TaxID=2979115 RepID=A0AAT9FIR0_9BACT